MRWTVDRSAKIVFFSLMCCELLDHVFMIHSALRCLLINLLALHLFPYHPIKKSQLVKAQIYLKKSKCMTEPGSGCHDHQAETWCFKFLQFLAPLKHSTPPLHSIGHAGNMLLFSYLYQCISYLCLCFNQLVTAIWQSWIQQTDDRESVGHVHA